MLLEPVLEPEQAANVPVAKKDYEAAKKKWQKEKAESNKKAQDKLADHVK